MPRMRVRRFRACHRKRALWKKSRVDRRVGGDPINLSDADGRCEILCWTVVGIIVVVGTYVEYQENKRDRREAKERGDPLPPESDFTIGVCVGDCAPVYITSGDADTRNSNAAVEANSAVTNVGVSSDGNSGTPAEPVPSEDLAATMGISGLPSCGQDWCVTAPARDSYSWEKGIFDDFEGRMVNSYSNNQALHEVLSVYTVNDNTKAISHLQTFDGPSYDPGTGVGGTDVTMTPSDMSAMGLAYGQSTNFRIVQRNGSPESFLAAIHLHEPGIPNSNTAMPGPGDATVSHGFHGNFYYVDGNTGRTYRINADIGVITEINYTYGN